MSIKNQFIYMIGCFCLILCSGTVLNRYKGIESTLREPGNIHNKSNTDTITIFMCGDVMLGRGIDQILPYPGDSILYEQYMKSALGYVRLAEKKNGPIPLPTNNEYIWGYTIKELEEKNPDLRMINLETAITQSEEYWKHKGINYRMNPANILCLKTVKIDYCSLANNHVLDWGYEGLSETLKSLKRAGLKYSGAGMTVQEAKHPAIFEIKDKCRILVFGFGFTNSGIPQRWAVGKTPGVNVFTDYSPKTVKQIKNTVNKFAQEGDIIIASVHWEGNWGYGIDKNQQKFAHQLIEEVGIDVIHGHSSHHVKDIEVYNKRLILFGCGDFLNDYEGISGHEMYRDDLGLMYFANLDASSGKLLGVRMVPTKIMNFRINRPDKLEMQWMYNMLNREEEKYNITVEYTDEKELILKWE